MLVTNQTDDAMRDLVMSAYFGAAERSVRAGRTEEARLLLEKTRTLPGGPEAVSRLWAVLSGSDSARWATPLEPGRGL